MLGRLTLEAFKHDQIVMFGVMSMIGAGLLAVILLTVFKKWKWLYKEWLTTLDPKKIGIMYIFVAILMLLKGISDAGLMRVQQATSSGASEGIMSATHFQQIFSAHGTTMIFFVAMGLMFGLINLIVPLQIGARDVAFPLVNAISFWLFVAGMLLINTSLAIGEFSAAGWLAYPPLSELAYSPGVGVDYWIWALQIAGIGSLLSGVNFITTILRMRCPGMKLMRMPLFCWSVLGSMTLVVSAFPILTVTLALLALDRYMGMHFFTSGFGGNPMMYVNLIWAWGHPEVYILILPAFGVFSEVVATFSKKRLFGYKYMVYAIIAITVLSYLVWLHHFFTMGAGANVNAFFGIMTMIIAIPTGVKVFNWLFTMYRGRVKFSVPMLWFLGFVFTFTIGGVTGVIMAVPPVDFQLHNSLFLVAHFHNMIIGGVVFGYLAAINYWFPKFFGFKLNERLGKLSFYFWIVGFATAFIPLYILGIMGATRRLNHYDASQGWQSLFIVAAFGALLIVIGIALLVAQIIVSVIKRKQNIDYNGDPWDARNLEWSTASPVPFYNFAVLPEVHDRNAWWDAKHKKHKIAEPTVYDKIVLPKNTSIGFLIGVLAFMIGFGLVWHITWLAAAPFIVIVCLLIYRSNQENTEYTVPMSVIERIEKANKLKAQAS